MTAVTKDWFWKCLGSSSAHHSAHRLGARGQDNFCIPKLLAARGSSRLKQPEAGCISRGRRLRQLLRQVQWLPMPPRHTLQACCCSNGLLNSKHHPSNYGYA